jgi:hypothetical protein
VNSSWGNAAEVVLAALAVIGVSLALIRWFYHRGEHESMVVKALNENTIATREVAKGLLDFKAETLATLRDHDWRIKFLEDNKK